MSDAPMLEQELRERLKADFGSVEYRHKTYSAGCIIDYDFSEIRFRKRPWVPEWLFRWFAMPDMLDLIDRKVRETRERSKQMVLEAIKNTARETNER